LSALDESLLSRRDFLAVAALGTASLRLALADDMKPAEDSIYVGTYTSKTESKGLYLVKMTRTTGALRLVGPVADAIDPSYVAVSMSARFVYAVNEMTEYEGKPSGAVSAFARDRATGALTLVNRVPSGGGAPCYVTFDRTGKFLLVANYVGGSVSAFPIRKDGGLGDASAFIQHTGHGANAERQESPHAHCIMPDPANRHVLVSDLGLDRVFVYGFNARTGTLSVPPVAHAEMPGGAGPRHLAFHPNGRILYVVNELNSTVVTLRYDAKSGTLTKLQSVPSVGLETPPNNSPADVHVHPSGRFLYMSNRGHNSIATFAIDPTTFTLRQLQLEPTGGDWPRNFAIDPSGRFLFVAHQRSNSIVTHRIDTRTGMLTSTGATLDVPAPVCLQFVPRSAGA
jgi:6-phosphogluconolactonase